MTLFSVLFAPIIVSYSTGEEDWTLTSWFAEGRQLGGDCQSVSYQTPLSITRSTWPGKAYFVTKVPPSPTPLPFCLSHTAFLPLFDFSAGYQSPQGKICVPIYRFVFMNAAYWKGSCMRVTPVCHSGRCIQNSAWLKAELLRISSILLPGSKKWSLSYRGAVGLNLYT